MIKTEETGTRFRHTLTLSHKYYLNADNAIKVIRDSFSELYGGCFYHRGRGEWNGESEPAFRIEVSLEYEASAEIVENIRQLAKSMPDMFTGIEWIDFTVDAVTAKHFKL